MTVTSLRTVDREPPPRLKRRRRSAARLSGIRRDLRNPLLRNGHLLTLSSMLTAAVGLGYWAVAARRYDVSVIGTNSAAITLMTLAAFIAQLNLSSAVVRFVPTAGRHTMRLVAGAYAVSACFAVLVGSVFCVAIATLTPQAGFMTGIGPAVMFVGTTVLYSLFTIQDGVLVGLRRAWLVPVENVIFAIAKLGLVIALATAMPWHGIFASWALALCVAVFSVGGYLFVRAIPLHREADPAGTLPPRRQVTRFVIFDYLGAVCGMSSSSLLPVFVLAVLGTTENAYFSIAWVVSYSVHLIGTNMGTSLVAEMAKRPSELRNGVRHVLSHTATVLIPAAALLIALAPWVLDIFGAGYREACSPLRLLLVAAIPNLIVTVAISSARVQTRLAPLITVQGAQLLLVGALGWPLVRMFGIEGAALTWLIAQLVLAGILLMRRDWWLNVGSPRVDPGPTQSWQRMPLPIARVVAVVLRGLTLLRLQSVLNRLAVRRDSGACDEHALAELVAGAPGDWTTARRLRNRADVTVALLSSGTGPTTGVLKLARNPEGADALRSQRSILTSFADDPRLSDCRSLIPEVLASRDSSDTAMTVESYKPGHDLATLLERHPERVEQMTVMALKVIGEFHRRTGALVDIDENDLEQWVDQPLNMVHDACRMMSPRLLPAVDRAGALLRHSLAGRRALVSWTHRDFTPENVRLSGVDGPVTGIVDWGGARPDQLALLDDYLLVLCASRLVEGRQFGDVVARRLRAGGLVLRERRPLRAAGADPLTAAIDEQTAILLTWLHYLAETWRKSTLYQRNVLWWVANVLPVLRLIERMDDRSGSPVRPQAAVPAVTRAGAPHPATSTVAVVICTYTEERWRQTISAIESVRRQTRKADEIVLVVDGDPELQKRFGNVLAGVTIIGNRQSPGLSGARNSGLAATSSDVVAFLDDDATAAPDWLESLLGAYSGPDVLSVGGRVLPDWSRGRPGWFPPEFDWVVGCSYRGLPAGRSVVRNLIGANMSFRRDLLIEAGGFDPDLGRVGAAPVGCEETELCIRLQRRHPDGVAVYEPAAQVSHHVPESRATLSYFRSRCYSEGLSKALVAQRVGPSRALSSEKAYLLSAIPRAFGRTLHGMLRGQRDAPGALVALVTGVAVTCVGYATGRLRLLTGAVRARPSRPRSRVVSLATGSALLVAFGLWLLSLPRVRLDLMGDYGLVPLLPATYWAALAILLVSFSTLVWTGAERPLLQSAHVLSLVAFLHATPSLLYPALRYSWAWKHIGVVDFFMRHHSVDTSVKELSAYQNWPGFFTLNAMLTEAAGLPSPVGYASWAPFFFGVLMLGPVYLIFQSLTGDQRLIWAGLVIYVLGAWVGQDYFAPQAMAFFLYLTLIAICLRHLGPERRAGTPPARSSRSYKFVAIVMVAAIAPTHQLTPLLLIAGLTALALCRYRVKTVLVAAIVFAAGWDVLFAWPWIAENLTSIGSSFGTIGQNATSAFISLSDASHSQMVIAYFDRALTAAIGLLAIVGFLRRFRRHRQWVVALLAVGPLPMVLMNDYGGEIIFRVYLFGLPFLAFYAAAAIFPAPSSGRTRYSAVALAVILMLLTPAFLFAYFGKESVNYFSRNELAISRYLFGTAPRGALIVGASTDFPWAYVNYEIYDYFRFAELLPKDRLAMLQNPIGRLDDVMAAHHHAYLVITRSQIAQLEMVGTMPPGGLAGIIQRLAASPRFTVIFRNPDGVVITLAQPRPGFSS